MYMLSVTCHMSKDGVPVVWNVQCSDECSGRVSECGGDACRLCKSLSDFYMKHR